MKLSLAKLSLLNPSITTPGYDRAALSPGILHIGVGNFFRGHQAVYMDDLFNLGIDQDWGIVGAGVSNGSINVRKAMKPQDWLTTVVARDGDGDACRVISPMIDFLEPNLETHDALREGLLDPRIRIVSTTVTEGGYFQDEAGNFDKKNPKIVHDAENPDSPVTTFGCIVQALRKRREAGDPPFTVMCCDNVPHSGEVVRNVGTYDVMKCVICAYRGKTFETMDTDNSVLVLYWDSGRIGNNAE